MEENRERFSIPSLVPPLHVIGSVILTVSFLPITKFVYGAFFCPGNIEIPLNTAIGHEKKEKETFNLYADNLWQNVRRFHCKLKYVATLQQHTGCSEYLHMANASIAIELLSVSFVAIQDIAIHKHGTGSNE